MINEGDFALDNDRIPNHIAIVMDGNGRWAKKRKVTKKAGHKAGAETLEKITEAAMSFGVKYLTVYAFSTENWTRSDDEVKGLMDLLRMYLNEHIKTAEKRNVRIKIVGDKSKLDKDIQDKIIHLENLTKEKTGLTLNIALNYGGRDEIIRAVRNIADDIDAGIVSVDEISEQVFSTYLDTKDIPDPELMIRTSGEVRISNFLLWQLAYSELDFSTKLWPDYNENDLKEAIWRYQSIDRKFGGRNS